MGAHPHGTMAPAMQRIGPRITALLFAAAFLGSASIDAFGLHPCPHHNGSPASGTAVPGDPAEPPFAHGGQPIPSAAQRHHEDATGSDAPEHPEHPTGSDAQEHGEHEGACTCVGTCQADGASASLFGHGSHDIVLPAFVGITAVSSVQSAHLPGQPPFLLPYAHAPPSAL